MLKKQRELKEEQKEVQRENRSIEKENKSINKANNLEIRLNQKLIRANDNLVRTQARFEKQKAKGKLTPVEISEYELKITKQQLSVPYFEGTTAVDIERTRSNYSKSTSSI